MGRDGNRQRDGKQTGREQDTLRRDGRRWEQKPRTRTVRKLWLRTKYHTLFRSRPILSPSRPHFPVPTFTSLPLENIEMTADKCCRSFGFEANNGPVGTVRRISWSTGSQPSSVARAERHLYQGVAFRPLSRVGARKKNTILSFFNSPVSSHINHRSLLPAVQHRPNCFYP